MFRRNSLFLRGLPGDDGPASLRLFSNRAGQHCCGMAASNHDIIVTATSLDPRGVVLRLTFRNLCFVTALLVFCAGFSSAQPAAKKTAHKAGSKHHARSRRHHRARCLLPALWAVFLAAGWALL